MAGRLADRAHRGRAGALPEGWQLTDGRHTAPVHRAAVTEAALWRLAAVSTGRPLTVFGEYGHQGFAPVTAWGADGRPIGLTAP